MRFHNLETRSQWPEGDICPKYISIRFSGISPGPGNIHKRILMSCKWDKAKYPKLPVYRS